MDSRSELEKLFAQVPAEDCEISPRFKLPVHEVDERYTTADAERAGAVDLDAAAAAILLEQHLAAL